MDFDSIIHEAKFFFSNSSGCHDYFHTERVLNLSLQIGKSEGADLEVIKLAAILHDIGRSEQDRTNGAVCHAQHGAKLAKEILTKYKVDPTIIDSVIHCIETHRFRGDKKPVSLEAKCLTDADNLEAIGAIGIGRAFNFAGEHGATVHIKGAIPDKSKEYTKEDTAYHEFAIKLSKIKDKMLTLSGKKIAEDRHKFMVSFFDRLDSEVDGVL